MGPASPGPLDVESEKVLHQFVYLATLGKVKTMTELMNAIVLTGHGGLEKLIYTQVPKPKPQKGEILIKVGACSLNNADLNLRNSWYASETGFPEITGRSKSAAWNQNKLTFPRIQGSDPVGKVVEIGDGVESEILNQRVLVDPLIRADKLGEYGYIGSEIDGGFAEYAVVPASNSYPINSPLSDVELATLPCSYSTAENLLTKGRVSAEDTVLIMGASGGVGSAAVKLAKIRGATIIAIAGASKQNIVRELGADYVYDKDEQLAANLANHQITVSLDVVGGKYFNILIESLEVAGRYVCSGAIAGPMVELNLRDLIYKDLEMIGATRFDAEVFKRLVSYVELGQLMPTVAKVFPLDQIKEAQKFFQSKSYCGKVVITPESNINK